MKCSLPALIALAVSMGEPGFAEETGVYRIRAKVEMIALPTAAALRLLPRLQNADQCEGACLDLQRLVRSGEAELLEQPTVVLGGGMRAQVESGPEIRWPTEFEPPSLPGSFGNSPDVARAPRQQSWGPITPYSFESDDLGAHLEFEASPVHEASGLVLNSGAVASLSSLDGWREFVGPADPHGVVGVIRQPIISRYKIQALLSLRPGAHKLLGSFTCAKPHPHVIVFILSATAVRLDLPEPAK